MNELMANELHDIKHEKKTFSFTNHPPTPHYYFSHQFLIYFGNTQTFHGNYDGNDHGAGNEAREWA